MKLEALEEAALEYLHANVLEFQALVRCVFPVQSVSHGAFFAA